MTTIHGGDIYRFEAEMGMRPLDFSENTNPLSMPQGVKDAICNEIDQYAAYPDPSCRALTAAVAAYYHLPEAYFLFGNGAADLIFKIAYHCKPKQVLLLAPTFAEYETALTQAGSQVFYYPLCPEHQFAIGADILPLAKGKTVFLCNPNNPTGQLCPKGLLEQLAQQAERLVIDECFMDFVVGWENHSFLPLLAQYPNVIVLKAFTKIFALAGLRLGFCLSADANLLTQINTAGQPWSVSSVAQVAGIACCNQTDYLTESLAVIAAERQFLKDALASLGYTVYESHANYLLFRAKKHLAETLRPQGVMIRSCANYHGLGEDFYRVAVKTHAENCKLIAALT